MARRARPRTTWHRARRPPSGRPLSAPPDAGLRAVPCPRHRSVAEDSQAGSIARSIPCAARRGSRACTLIPVAAHARLALWHGGAAQARERSRCGHRPHSRPARSSSPRTTPPTPSGSAPATPSSRATRARARGPRGTSARWHERGAVPPQDRSRTPRPCSRRRHREQHHPTRPLRRPNVFALSVRAAPHPRAAVRRSRRARAWTCGRRCGSTPARSRRSVTSPSATRAWPTFTDPHLA